MAPLLLCSLVCLIGAGLACAGAAPEPEPTRGEARRARALVAALEAADPGTLAAGGFRVRLAFAAEADLDLYVTDPLQETVYFANTPSRSGGRLDADRRCAHASPRIEEIVFPAALPGRYRIGVDHPERCDGQRAAAIFVVETEHRGRRELRSGRIAPRHFLPVVHELDLGQRLETPATPGIGAPAPRGGGPQSPPVVK